MNSIESLTQFTPKYFDFKKTIVQSISVALGSIASSSAWFFLMSEIVDEDDCSLAASFVRINTNLSLGIFSLIGGSAGYFISKKLTTPNQIKKPTFLV